VTEPEIFAVRQIPPALADPGADSVGRTWQKMVNAQRERTPRSAVRRWLVPATAALAIGAIALTILFARGGGAGGQFQPGDNSTPLDTQQALAQLVAASAQAGPAQVPATGQVVHVRLDGWAAALDPSGGGQMEQQIREIWMDPQGLIALQITDGTASMMDGPKGDRDGNIAAARAALAKQGPSFYRPTPQWIAGLPSDPAVLCAVLQQTVEAGDWSQAHAVWSMMAQFYANGDLLLGPAGRAALFQAYAHVDGLQAETVMIGGETFIGLRHNEKSSADEVLFDPANGHAVGVRSLYAGQLSVTPAPGQPTLDAGVIYQAFYTQELVPSTLIP
jgi:hypothetical protein